MDYSSIASLPNLSPGTRSPDVKTLQTWLIQNGFNIPDGATGYYGDETKAAVSAWQRQAGFDTQGNPGYFGPLSKSYITTQTSGATKPTAAPTSTASLQKGTLGAIGDVASSAATLGTPIKSITDALKAAQNDPNIISKYADMLSIDKNAFTQNLQQLQISASTEGRNRQMQFENERKQLSEQSAAAGRAYSGFRGEAQKQLADTESGIVTSSRAAYQKSLDDTRQAFESKYGTAATPSANLSFINPFTSSGTSISGQIDSAGTSGAENLSGATVGGITGTAGAAKQSDIMSSELQSYQTAQFPKV